MFSDTHSHLFEEDFDNDREDVVKRLRDTNTVCMFVGFNNTNNIIAYDLAQSLNMYSSAGLRPDTQFENIEENLTKLREFVKNHKLYAIGECGLDYHWEPYDKERQVKLFEEQIKLSIELKLPLIIHSRDSHKETFDILKKYEGKAFGIMHCYSGSLELAREYVKMGWYISLGGPLTFKNAKEPKKVAEGIDISRLLIETDCPFLTPEPFRGKRNESSYVHYVAEEMAKIKNMSVKEVEDITYQNALNVYRIKE